MKLTFENIDQLYKFTCTHFVEWYDLQTELVDHLANDIELIWEKEPNLSFDQAKSKAFKKFGIFGFQDVISSRANALNKQYWKMVWKIFKQYFKLPKIILILLISSILFTTLQFFEDKSTIVYILFVIISLVPIIFSFYNRFQMKKKFNKTGKKWLFEQNIVNLGGFMFLSIQIPNIAILLFKFHAISMDLTSLFLWSVMLSLFGILNYLLIWVIPKQMEKKMTVLYPEYKLYKKA